MIQPQFLSNRWTAFFCTRHISKPISMQFPSNWHERRVARLPHVPHSQKLFSAAAGAPSPHFGSILALNCGPFSNVAILPSVGLVMCLLNFGWKVSGAKAWQLLLNFLITELSIINNTKAKRTRRQRVIQCRR